MIVNDNSSAINKFGASLTDDTRVVIYNHHVFIMQATGRKSLTYLLRVREKNVLLANIRLRQSLAYLAFS